MPFVFRSADGMSCASLTSCARARVCITPLMVGHHIMWWFSCLWCLEPSEIGTPRALRPLSSSKTASWRRSTGTGTGCRARCAPLALSPLPLIFSYKSEKPLCGAAAHLRHQLLALEDHTGAVQICPGHHPFLLRSGSHAQGGGASDRDW